MVGYEARSFYYGIGIPETAEKASIRVMFDDLTASKFLM